jgi:hypothetical protein
LDVDGHLSFKRVARAGTPGQYYDSRQVCDPLCGDLPAKTLSVFPQSEVTRLALFRHGGGVERCPLLEAKQKTSALSEYFAF